MPRGGKRRGTPGKGYTNRTDLGRDYNNTQSAAGGGMTPPPAPAQQTPPPQPTGPVGPTPDDIPGLGDPTAYKDEPITAGLATGPGPGRETMPMMQAPNEEARQIARYLPELQRVAQYDGAPATFKALVRYLQAYR